MGIFQFVVTAGGGAGIPSEVSWDSLETLEPASTGLKRLIPSSSFSGSTVIGDILVERYADKWSSAVNTTILNYMSAHPIPAPTSYSVVEYDGGSGGNEAQAVSTITTSWMSLSGDTITTAYPFKNSSGIAQDRIKLGLLGGVKVPGTYKIQIKRDSSYQSSTGTWYQFSREGSQNIQVSQVDIGQASDDNKRAGYVETDWIEFSPPLAPNEAYTIWVVSNSTGSQRICVNEAFWYSYWPSIYNGAYAVTSVGDGIVNPGSMSFQPYTVWSVALEKVIYGRTSTTPLTNILMVGDSVVAMFNGFGAASSDYGMQGWCYQANELARVNGKRYRVSSFGIGGSNIAETFDRANALIPVCAANGTVLGVQCWTANDVESAGAQSALTKIAALQLACDAAGVKLIPFICSLPGSANAFDADPWLYPLTTEQIAIYHSVKDSLIATYPAFLDISACVADSVDPDMYSRTDSHDGVHLFVSNPTTGVGQHKQAIAFDDNIAYSLSAVGINILPTPITTPNAFVLEGGVAEIYSDNTPTVGDYMNNWGLGSATSATSVQVITNTTGQPVNRIRFMFGSGTTNTVDFAFKVKLGDDLTNVAGPWYSGAFGGNATGNVNWVSGSTKYIWSDWLTLPSALASGSSIVVMISGSGGNTKALPLSSSFSYYNWFDACSSIPSRISEGNGIAGDTMTWIYQSGSIGLAKIAWGFVDTTRNVVNIASFGDSTISMFTPFGGDDRIANGWQGWAYHANKLALANDYRYNISSFGRGGSTLTEYHSYALSAISGLAGMVDVITFQPWTSNELTEDASKAAHLALSASLKSACDAAGIAFMPLMICLPGAGTWSVDHYVDSLTAEQLRLYDEMRSAISSTYPAFIDAAKNSGVADASGTHYNLADSLDDNHCLVSNSTDKVGQYKLGASVHKLMPGELQSLGYLV